MKFLPSARSLVMMTLFWLGCLAGTEYCMAQSGSSGASTGSVSPSRSAVQDVTIPGPLRSFLRIAAISPQAPRSEIMRLLAYNIFQHGYFRATPTEYLLIMQRYVTQARALQGLAGRDQVIRVDHCADASPLLGVLGYKMRGTCGAGASLQTADPEQAFLTVDSGFPLTDLEDALQRGVPFVYPYPSAQVPVLFRNEEWLALRGPTQLSVSSSLDTLLGSPTAARLYFALSRMDAETCAYLQRSLGLNNLVGYAPALDFYGAQLRIRSGHVLVPGGSAAEPAWRTLAGVDPASPAKFISRLLAKDDGWLAAYFDALARVHKDEQDHLTRQDLLLNDYEAFRSPELKRSALTGVTRSGVALLGLDTRLAWDADGQPHVPGGLTPWKEILSAEARRDVGSWGKRARSFNSADQLLEAMTALTRRDEENSPVQLYLTLCELDRRRPADRQLSASTVETMAADFALLKDWYPVFSEFSELDDRSIEEFIDVAEQVTNVHGNDLRGNAVGAFQANIGLWQILARQGEIPAAEQNASWQDAIAPFRHVTSSTQLFDSSRASLQKLLLASGASANSPAGSIVDRLAGPVQNTPEGQRIHDALVSRMRSVLVDQRLVSLDTLFALSDGMVEMSKAGKKGNADLLSLAGELRGFELPRPIFTNQEKISWAPGVYASHHAELQVQTDMTRVLTGPANETQVEAARGQLTPFLRDALVGLNYAYYEPPGAQILHVNSLFVRTHDFLGTSVIGSNCVWENPKLIGVGVSAGGGAYLMGSLADLPYALATAEAAFVVPEHVQALVWEVVPSLLADATVPRWWHVSADELHAVALYQASGEELLSASTADAHLRAEVLALLFDQVSAQRFTALERATAGLPESEPPGSLLMPSETFYLAEEFHRRFPTEAEAAGPASKQLASLASSHPELLDPGRLSSDFGVSHLTLARTNARELFHLQPFPFSTGATNRIFAESLESTNLYWARLADESGYDPVVLNEMVPELTHHMVGKIFATNMEDWPAVMRAMQETREDLREGKIAGFAQPGHSTSSQQGAQAGGGGSSLW